MNINDLVSELYSIDRKMEDYRSSAIEGIYLANQLKFLLELHPELLPEKRDYLLDRIERLLGE